MKLLLGGSRRLLAHHLARWGVSSGLLGTAVVLVGYMRLEWSQEPVLRGVKHPVTRGHSRLVAVS